MPYLVYPGLYVAKPKPSTVGQLAVSNIPLGDRQQAAGYVADMTRELSGLVRKHHLGTLSALLEMVRLEAEQIAQR